jgi:hypothetical protein
MRTFFSSAITAFCLAFILAIIAGIRLVLANDATEVVSLSVAYQFGTATGEGFSTFILLVLVGWFGALLGFGAGDEVAPAPFIVQLGFLLLGYFIGFRSVGFWYMIEHPGTYFVQFLFDWKWLFVAIATFAILEKIVRWWQGSSPTNT